MTPEQKETGLPPPVDSNPAHNQSATTPTTNKPESTKKGRRKPRPRCTCAMFGICDDCREIADRRIAFELKRRP